MFVGYALDSPVYLIWNPRTKRLVRSCNVEFNELAVAGSTVMGERTSSNNKSGDDSNDDGGGVVQPHRDSFDNESGEQEASEHTSSANNQLGEQEDCKQLVRRSERTKNAK